MTGLVQKALDPHCLFGVNINPESRVKVSRGPAKPELVEQGWRVFLVKVHNEAGSTALLRAVSPHAQSMHGSPEEDLRNRWLDLHRFPARNCPTTTFLASTTSARWSTS